MNRHSLIVALVAAALLSLPACVSATGASRSTARPLDVSQLPPPPGSTLVYAGGPRPLMHPVAGGQSEREARRAGTSGLRPGISGGERAELRVATRAYEPPRLPMPKQEPLTPPKKPALFLPSLQGAS